MSKICPKCQRNLSLDNFYLSKAKGYQCYCKSCQRESKQRWATANAPKRRINGLWTRYRLREADWQAMYAAQGGLCAVCKTAKATDVDHDRGCCPTNAKTCGKCIRSLLCVSCNTFVGKLEADPARTKSALEYIRTHAPLV